MRHNNTGRKLGRTTAHREAMFRNMAVSLIQHGRIKTTIQKAKELRVFAERLVSLGKTDSLHARRLAFDRLRDRDAVVKLFNVIAPAFATRQGGYTRIFKLSTRPGDGSEMALIEYLGESVPRATKAEKAEKSEPKKVKKAAKASAEGSESAKPVKAKAVKAPKVKAEPKVKKAAKAPKAVRTKMRDA